jgi:mRNA interferase MazF
MVEPYIPDRGDIVWINFSPHTGREQKGRRPAVVLSPRMYNEKIGLALMCPITTRSKGYLFEVPFLGQKAKGVVLADQVRTFDWRQRPVSFVEKISSNALVQVQHNAITLITETYT